MANDRESVAAEFAQVREAVEAELAKPRYETSPDRIALLPDHVVRDLVVASWWSGRQQTPRKTFRALHVHDHDDDFDTSHTGEVRAFIDDNGDVLYQCDEPNCSKKWGVNTVSL